VYSVVIFCKILWPYQIALLIDNYKEMHLYMTTTCGIYNRTDDNNEMPTTA